MNTDEPRWDLIRHLQDQIDAGTYITRGKLEVVSRRLIEAIERTTDMQDLGREDA